MNYVGPIRDKKKIDDMKVILSSGRHGQRNVVLFSIGINTAYRISDLGTLKLSDVLEVSRNKVVVKDRLKMKEQKTGKQNSVVISKKLKRTILHYVNDKFPEEVAGRDFNHYLFPSGKGTDQPLDRKSTWKIISTAAKRVGLEEIGTHSMRKTFSYFLYKQGTRIEIIQSLLNHSSPKETLRYIGIEQEEKDTAVISLDL